MQLISLILLVGVGVVLVVLIYGKLFQLIRDRVRSKQRQVPPPGRSAMPIPGQPIAQQSRSQVTSPTAPPGNPTAAPGIPALGAPYLELTSAGQAPIFYPLAQQTITIGRDPACDIVVDQRLSAVSRRHAQLLYDAGTYILVDLNSENGIAVNGARVGRNRLRDGALINLGQAISFTFHQNQAKGAP